MADPERDIPMWAVHRQVDHGNRFPVRRGLVRDEASRLATELESHGHKQLYWVEPERPVALRTEDLEAGVRPGAPADPPR